VVQFERSDRIGGQLALAAEAPMHAEVAGSLTRNYERLLEIGGVDLRLGADTEPEEIAALEPDALVVATGARPFVPDVPLEGVMVVQAWDVLAAPRPEGRRVVVADWGGDASGLACAELLREAGNEVTLAVGSAALGETLHQYQRNVYAGRLYRAGVRVEHHLELAGTAGGRARFRNLFAPELETELEADLLVLALGRVPDRALIERLGGFQVHEAGDCTSPRGLEEAVLEGTLAARKISP
jgi:pyruvate/2-oxoglutarate dehydrogenase complex dihydrolipoamide dehydrogenase (E3) component